MICRFAPSRDRCARLAGRAADSRSASRRAPSGCWRRDCCWRCRGSSIARLGFGMLVWDALVIAAALWDGARLPAPQTITVERSWSNAPSLDSETEIELAVEQSGENDS